jgi:hypothetical protein
MAWSILCGSLCVLLLLSWVRNFWRADVAWMSLPSGLQAAVASADGHVEVGLSRRSLWQAATSGFESYTSSSNPASSVLMPIERVIRYRYFPNGDFVLILPHWLLAAAMLLVTLAPWIRWSWRFTIRTLLVFMAFVAVILTMAVTAGER